MFKIMEALFSGAYLKLNRKNTVNFLKYLSQRRFSFSGYVTGSRLVWDFKMEESLVLAKLHLQWIW